MGRGTTIAVWSLASVLAILLQPKITIFEFPLNLTLALVYAFAIKSPPIQSASVSYTDVSAEMRGTGFGAAIGLIEDIMSGTLPGLNMLSKGLAGFAGSIIFRDLFFQWTPLIGGIVLFFFTICDGLIILLVREFIAGTSFGGYASVELIIMQALMNIPIGICLKSGQKTGTAGYR